jgi:predicted phosphate transport protein (TIGR00153 family)
VARFSFLPAEVKFYDWFEKASANLLEGARLLQDLLEHYDEVENKVAQITEVEHKGDFIVHEVTELLPRSLITPIDHEDIQRLIAAVDDALDSIEDTAVRLVIYRVEEVKEPARRLARLITSGAQELDAAVGLLRDKQNFKQVHAHIVEINTLENNGDRVYRDGLTDLVARREELFDLIRWREIYDFLEATTDRVEDAGDILQRVIIANA